MSFMSTATQKIVSEVHWFCMYVSISVRFLQDGIIVENMHDIPYVHRDDLEPHVTAAMTAVCCEVRRTVGDMPVGVQILAGGNKEALATALAAGLLKLTLSYHYLAV